MVMILISKSIRWENQMSSDWCWHELSSYVIWKLGRVNGLLLAIPMQIYSLFNANRPIRKDLLKQILWNSIRAHVLRPKCTYLRMTEDMCRETEDMCTEKNVYLILRIGIEGAPASICIVSKTLYSISKVRVKKVSGRKGSPGFTSTMLPSILLRLFFATSRQVHVVVQLLHA